MNMRKYATTLVIPDAHDGPEHNKDRFEALGNFIVENKPDNIVQIGDFMNLDSINFFDTNKPLIKEGKRLKDDIDSGIEAYEKIMKPIRNLWKKQARWKTKKYNPNRHWLLGNHEVRTWRYTLDKPELSGFIPETDFVGAGKDKWNIVEYRQYVYIDGTAFTHAPMNRRVNQPISGEYVTKRATETHNTSIVFGHTHRFGVHTMKRTADDTTISPLIQSCNVGWYADYMPEYMEGNEATCDWWAGLVMLTHTGHGTIDITQHSIDRVKEDYL